MRRNPTSAFFITQHLVYFFVSEECREFKIGYSSRLRHRLTELRVGCPGSPYLLGFIRYTCRKEAQKAEDLFHQWFAEFRTRGEWFELSTNTQAMIEHAVFESKTLLEQVMGEIM